MLAVDAFVTVITWLVVVIPAVMTKDFKERIGDYNKRVIDLIVTAIYMSNCFSTPIVYYIFNNSFKVGDNLSSFSHLI